MKSKFIFSLFSILVLSSCDMPEENANIGACSVCPTLETYTLQNEFNEKQMAKAMEKGRNTISGEAFMRKSNGDIVTCAGFDALLVPVTDYSKERISILYGNAEKGFNLESRCVKFMPDNCQYHAMQGRKKCSSTGHFEFKNIKDGEYFVIAFIPWKDAENKKRGGALMEKVSLKGGERREMVMMHQPQ